MATPAHVLGHPLHPMIIPFPIGLWIFSLAADIVFRVTGDQVWTAIAIYSMAGGIVGAILAALPGMVDLFSLAPSRGKTLGWWHMGANVAALIIFIVDFLLRRSVATAGTAPFILSIIGVLLLGISGWLGGEMVYVEGVAVEKR